jgi:hypothetical protein|uniref:Uncharacterized protein n=1 Tax=virus sp. ctPYc18 TaxID=2828251 RepID=A0A8S5RD73_9VIRU|nr:MAG TPA: hypothetical protein [virus sp. ctPYc18]
MKKLRKAVAKFIKESCTVSHDSEGNVTIVVLSKNPFFIPAWDMLSTEDQFGILEEYCEIKVHSVRIK